MKRQKGLSLVELMVAMVLGLLVVGAVIELFISSRQLYRVQDVKARMQEDGRYALHYIGEFLSRGGYRGCESVSQQQSDDYDNAIAVNDGTEQGRKGFLNVLTSESDYFWQLQSPVIGHEATGNNSWTPAKPGDITDAVSDSDILTIRTVGSFYLHVQSHDADNFSAPLQIGPDNGLSECDPATEDTCANIMMVSTCDAVAVFQVTNEDAAETGVLEHATGIGTPGNSRADLGGNFEGGWVNTIASQSFYVRNNPEGIPSLYQKTLNNDPEALLEGVEQLQVTYGVDSDGDLSAEEYRTADQITGNISWTDVISVRISMVMININPDNDDTDTNLALGDGQYFLEGAQVTPNDGRLRRVYTQTFMLKNRAS